jgi:NADH-quinone oxidoreductase subunit K
MMISYGSCLILSWILFVLGLIVMLTRRSILTLLLALMLMFHATSLTWVAAVRFHGDPLGHVTTLAILGAIVSQFLIGLGVVIRIVRGQESADISKHNYLKN